MLGYGASGWDVQALNGAYCQHDGDFVTVADSDRFQGIICNRNGALVYRGLNKDTGQTLTAPAEAMENGYAGIVGSTRYEIGPDQFEILTDGERIAADPVNTYVLPTMDPFIPGDLGLSREITFPRCDGTGVVLLASSFGATNAKREVQAMLDRYPDAEYLRTDLACDSFNRPSGPVSNRQFIYGVYLPADSLTGSVCTEVQSRGTYAVWLRNGVTPAEGRVNCN